MGETRRHVSPATVFARPTADQIWLGPTQQAALSQLSRPPSSGKSTLLNHLAIRLDPNAVVLQCRGPKDDAAAVLASLLLSADLGPWDLSEIEQRNLLTVFVQQRRSQGRRVLLLIDDVHGIQPAAWEEVERLLAFKVDRRPGFEVLVAGPVAFARRFREGEDVVRSALPSSAACLREHQKISLAIWTGGCRASKCEESSRQ
jgi:hypothetical protein